MEIAYAEKLRADLKEHGLEHAVRLMSVAERGEARRCIRNALAAYVLKLINDKVNA